MFAKQVNQDSIKDVTEKILAINKDDDHLEKLYKVYGIKYKRQPIEMHIDSYGGQVYQIMGLIGLMEVSKTPIHTYGLGAAMSCGFILLISGHKRFAYKYSRPMYHQVSGGTIGKVADMEQSMEETVEVQKFIEQQTLNKTNITKKMLKKNFKEKVDWFFSPEEAKKLNIVDKILK